MRPLHRVVLIALTLLTSPLFAAVRLTYDMGGKATMVVWPQSAFPLQYTVERRAADKYGVDVIDHAFAAWTAVPDANITFRDTGVSDGTQPGQNNVNSVTLLDGLFKDQGFIAVTTNWYDRSGVMTEADIQVDPSLVGSAYPALATIEHEVGHFLGLDHSPVLSAVMYPYVCKNATPNLDSDDRLAIAAVYPKHDPAMAGATLTGRVLANGSGVFAAQVVAVNERGEPIATALTDASGDFVLEGVPSGRYRVYAEPLDGPVSRANLNGIYRSADMPSFATRFASASPMQVNSGNVYGNLVIDASGPPVRLNPKYIGVAAPNAVDFTLNATPVALKPGTSVTIAIGGDGFTSGMTTFEVLNPSMTRVSDFRYGSNYVYATYQIAPDAGGIGSSSVLVASGNENAALTGALRIDSSLRARAVKK